MKTDKGYLKLIGYLKQQILQSRYNAARLANKELLLLYILTGKVLSEKLKSNEWGSSILKKISNDLQAELPGLKGFSDRNLYNMKLFYDEYFSLLFSQSATAKFTKSLVRRNFSEFSQSATAKLKNIKNTVLPEEFLNISFTHHVLLINKCKDFKERIFYMQFAAEECWSLSILKHHIESRLYKKRAKFKSNFDKTLPRNIKTTALSAFKDEYLLDFINIEESEDERVIENEITRNIKKFIMTMGKGFSFIGNQHRIEVGKKEFFVDLLFYNRYLQCLVAFELKKGEFKPEYAGKLNFYLNAIDDKMKLPHENPSIGIILCKEKDNAIVEYAFRSIDKAMGVATYKFTKKLPKKMKGILPEADDLRKLL